MNRNKFVSIILVATIFGFTSGIVGEIVARVYLLEKAFNVPLFGEINYLNNGANGSNLVISNPRKVIVEQSAKVMETAESVQGSIVGLYKLNQEQVKNKNATTAVEAIDFDASDYLRMDQALGQGFILTSDGWIISEYTPPELKTANKKINSQALVTILAPYVVLNHDRQVFTVDNVLFDSESNYSFWHVNVKDFPVKNFLPDNEINNGELVLAVNLEKASWLTTIIDQSRGNFSKTVNSSDQYVNIISLADKPSEKFLGAFLFNLNGDVVALIDGGGTARSISSYVSCINCLLKNKAIGRPVLGVNYVDLSKYIALRSVGLPRGALIAVDETGVALLEEGPAELAGLRAGDIILKINNKVSLSQAINKFIPGDEVTILFARDNQENSIKIVLGER